MSRLENAALDGSLFHPHRSPSPSRSVSTASPTNTDDDLGSDLSRPSSPAPTRGDGMSSAGVGAGGGDEAGRANQPQTGPKGVMSDRRNHDRHIRLAQHEALRDQIAEQERRKMVVMTSVEEDKARLLDDRQDEKVREKWRRKRMEELKSGMGSGEGEGDGGIEGGGVNRGGLREVGKEGFLKALERPGWVVVLIYEPDIPRCTSLLASTLQLSLSACPITLLRARATNLSFSLLSTQPSSTNATIDDEDIPPPKADPDVLPTLLGYKNGELEKTWIRVDWEVKEDGVEGLLQRAGILHGLNYIERGLLSGSDDDE